MKKQVVVTTPKLVITGEAQTYLEAAAVVFNQPVAEILGHALALQKAVYEEQQRGSTCRIYRVDGTVLDLIPV
jgi:hypothetical protein